MATPDPEVQEIRATLAETPLRATALDARSVVASLPEHRRDTPNDRIAHIQIQLVPVT